MGFVKSGKFRRVFNARLPLNDPRRFPKGYVPLQVDSEDIEERILSEIPIQVGVVTEVGADANVTIGCVLPSHRQSHSYI